MKKKLTGIIATLMLGSVLAGCGGATNSGSKNVSTSEIVKGIIDQVEVRKTAPVEGELLTQKFYLNMDDVEEQTIEEGQMNTGLEVVAVVKAKEGKAESVKRSFESAKLDKSSAAFYPGEREAVDASEIKVIGDYVGFFIIPDYESEEGGSLAGKAVEIFENALK